MLFTSKEEFARVFLYSCLWLSSMKSRYSLQYKPISHQSLCYSAGDILSRVNSEFDICYIQCFKRKALPKILLFNKNTLECVQIRSSTILLVKGHLQHKVFLAFLPLFMCACARVQACACVWE